MQFQKYLDSCGRSLKLLVVWRCRRHPHSRFPAFDSGYKYYCPERKGKSSIGLINKGLFTSRWETQGRLGKPHRWGNPPVHIISRFNLITFTWSVGWPYERLYGQAGYTPLKRATSPTWGPPSPCIQSLPHKIIFIPVISRSCLPSKSIQEIRFSPGLTSLSVNTCKKSHLVKLDVS